HLVIIAPARPDTPGHTGRVEATSTPGRYEGVSPAKSRKDRDMRLPDKRPTHGYIGRLRACGCAVAITTDDANRPSHTARNVAEFIRDGLYIERFSMEEYENKISKEETFLSCPHERREGTET